MKVMCSGNKGAKALVWSGVCLGLMACLRTRRPSGLLDQGGLTPIREHRQCSLIGERDSGGKGGGKGGLTDGCGLETSVNQRPYQANQTSAAR